MYKAAEPGQTIVLPEIVKRDRGRPRVIQNPRKIEAKVEQEVHEALSEIAKENGTTVADILRDLAQGYVEAHRAA
jgi:hypothetical protein